MRNFIRIVLICILGSFSISGYAQKDAPAISDTLDNVLLENQWSLGLHLNTNGWGLKFRKGRNLAALKQFMWEIEFSTYKSAKEVKTINPYFSNSKSFIYGKLNYIYFLRGGVGMQHILNRKPYWGGVQLSYLYYGGLSICMAKPVYLYIAHTTTSSDYQVREERYNPDDPLQSIDYIYGRGSFFSGITSMTFSPGVYGKGGLEFEFGTRNRAIKALEIGAIIDYTPFPVAIMAYNPKQSLFLTAYLSISFGKRYNKQ
jgi:hypothetical protein